MNRIVLLIALLSFHASARADATKSCPVLPPEAKVHWIYVQGPDFDVCYVTRPNSQAKLFGVYLGCCPSFHPENAKGIGRGTVGGREVTWFAPDSDSNSEEGPLSRQTLLSLGTKYRYMAHVWILADTQSELQQALQILERLRFRDPIAP